MINGDVLIGNKTPKELFNVIVTKQVRKNKEVTIVPRISEANKVILWEFFRDSISNDKKLPTVENICRNAVKFAEFNHKTFSEVTDEDVKDFVYYVNNRKLADTTKFQSRMNIKTFFTGIKNENAVSWITFKGAKPQAKEKKYDDLLEIHEIDAMINACKDVRDRAIIAVLYDSAARVGELHNCNISDVSITDKGTFIILDGKTGRREIMLFSSRPYIKEYIDSSHCKGRAKDTPLFVSFGYLKQRLEEHAVQNLLNKVAAEVGITKNVHPHLFRHTRITHLASSPLMNETLLRKFAGWKLKSTLPATYIHLAANSLDNALREFNGEKIEKKQVEFKLLSWTCSNHYCKETNGAANNYCFKCGYPKDVTIVRDDGELLKKQVNKILAQMIIDEHPKAAELFGWVDGNRQRNADVEADEYSTIHSGKMTFDESMTKEEKQELKKEMKDNPDYEEEE